VRPVRHPPEVFLTADFPAVPVLPPMNQANATSHAGPAEAAGATG
jgi:hypothetical protein